MSQFYSEPLFLNPTDPRSTTVARTWMRAVCAGLTGVPRRSAVWPLWRATPAERRAQGLAVFIVNEAIGTCDVCVCVGWKKSFAYPTLLSINQR